ncbi:hypothetical protein NIES806_15380 [Dolichospermum compactum NIES-806]|uniref:Uncharacterized protein n=1 Tax=Dolichospermum compactum NIES-806 TaxID=1973481 RepID=A0A1Z4V208_9CYAN|nr:hypothetical protein NIES806_15380 [Dolichospermum compactum NIES-806]
MVKNHCLALKSYYTVGWVVERKRLRSNRNVYEVWRISAGFGGIGHKPTLSRILLGFAVAQPNLHFLNRQVLEQ